MKYILNRKGGKLWEMEENDQEAVLNEVPPEENTESYPTTQKGGQKTK